VTLRATDFEFRYRFWMIGLIYLLGFSAYRIDPVNVVEYAVGKITGHGTPQAEILAHALFGVGALIMFFAAALRTWAAAYLKSDVVQDPALHAERLVADGPYRHLRNPLYLGGILVAFGFGFLAGRVGFVFISAGFAIFFLRLIGLEESRLAATQGETYREYLAKVPSLWPSLRPRVPAGGVRPQSRQAFAGEIFMWGFFAGMAAFAATLNEDVIWIITAAALALYILRSYALFSRRKARHSQ